LPPLKSPTLNDGGGFIDPATVGMGGRPLVQESTVMNSEKHTPNGLITIVAFKPPPQTCEELTQEPVRRTHSLAFEQERQVDEPEEE